MIEAREGQEGLGAVFLRGDAGRADAGLRERTKRAPAQIEDLDDVRRVAKVGDGDDPLADRHAFDDGVITLRHDVAPVLRRRVRRIDGNHPALRRAFGRLQVQRSVNDVAERLTRLADAHGDSSQRAGLQVVVEVGEPEIVRQRVDPVAEHEPVAVARERAERTPRGRERRVLLFRELPEQDRVVLAIHPGAMKHHLAAIRILRITQIAVHEPGAVRQPVGRLRLVGNLQRQDAAGVHLHEVQRRVLVAGVVGAVGDQLPVCRR